MALPSRPASQQLEATAVPGEPLIAFKDVRIGFDEGDVLRGISFEVWPGETKVLLGESGSGKTLIMKLACGLLRPDQGRIWVMGEDLGAMSENELLDFRRHVGFVFQEGALFDSLTVADNVAFRLREENLDDAEIEARVREVLRFVEMEPAIYMFPGELSGGMRRRVSIARALVDRPPLVFYDSPTAGLDPVTSQTIITLILRGRDLQGVTSMLATHRVQDAFGLARFRFDSESGRVMPIVKNGERSSQSEVEEAESRFAPTNVLVIRDGKIYFEGTAEDVLHTSDDYLKTFLASAE
ncbi:MAG TPA: ATP-binding cassette domain-containing protein [Candidatus Acidoferrales bacterium]|nr:ATP-binding cassette domain-containing protein [Candidatus Acidoferrales bacterium]